MVICSRNCSLLGYLKRNGLPLDRIQKNSFGDVLYGKLRPYLDKVLVAEEPGICTTEIVPIIPSRAIDSNYLRYLLKRPDFLAYVNKLSYGVKMPRLGTEDALNSIHPLPPLEEQLRIVKKVQELMFRCDELELLQRKKEQKRRAVHSGSINSLLKASGENGFSMALHFMVKNFSELYSVKENVTELRKVILQLAIMGKLVPQDPKDKPASELLKETETKKEKLIQAGIIKKQKELPLISQKEISFQVPNSWKFVRLGDICSLITDGEHQTPKRLNSGKMLLSAKNIRDGYIDYTDHDLISESDFDKAYKRCGPIPNDILMVSVGATIGRSSIVTESTRFVLVRSVALIRPFFNANYIDFFLKSPEGQRQINISTKATGQPCLYLEPITRLLIPIPPLSEQEKIVYKIHVLFQFCDSLENQILNQQNVGENLLNAVINPRLELL